MNIQKWYKQKEDEKWMKIEIFYSLGGMNYFYGKSEPRGYSVSFTTVERGEDFEKYAPMSDENFRIFIKEVKRKSKKTERELIEFIGSIIEELFELYKENNKEEIFNKLREFNKKEKK